MLNLTSNSSCPFISVLMTSYNRENYISEAIESVLSSTYTDFELIIVDDCSLDATFSIAESYAAKDIRVRVYQNEKNLGDYPNRNKAASYAKGKYLKYWDSDDLMYPHCLEVISFCMAKYPLAGIGLIKDRLKPYDQPMPFEIADPYNIIHIAPGLFNNSPGSMVINRDFFNQVGGFSEKRYIGDYEFLLRNSINTSYVIIPGILGWDRTHEGQERAFDPVLYEELRCDVLFFYLERYKKHSTIGVTSLIKKHKKKSILKYMLFDLLKLRIRAILKKRILVKYIFK